jgi:hypothetical protein
MVRAQSPISAWFDAQLMSVAEQHCFDWAAVADSMRHAQKFASSLYPRTAVLLDDNCFSADVCRARYAYLIYRKQHTMQHHLKMDSSAQTEIAPVKIEKRNFEAQVNILPSPSSSSSSSATSSSSSSGTSSTSTSSATSSAAAAALVPSKNATPVSTTHSAEPNVSSMKETAAKQPAESSVAVVPAKSAEPEPVEERPSGVSDFSVFRDSLKDRFSAIYAEICTRLPSISHAEEDDHHAHDSDEDVPVFSSGIVFNDTIDSVMLRPENQWGQPQHPHEAVFHDDASLDSVKVGKPEMVMVKMPAASEPKPQQQQQLLKSEEEKNKSIDEDDEEEEEEEEEKKGNVVSKKEASSKKSEDTDSEEEDSHDFRRKAKQLAQTTVKYAANAKTASSAPSSAPSSSYSSGPVSASGNDHGIGSSASAQPSSATPKQRASTQSEPKKPVVEESVDDSELEELENSFFKQVGIAR